MKKKYVLVYTNDNEEVTILIKKIQKKSIAVITCDTIEQLLEYGNNYHLSLILLDCSFALQNGENMMYLLQAMKLASKDYVLILGEENIVKKLEVTEIDNVINENLPLEKQFEEILMYWESIDLIDEEVSWAKSLVVNTKENNDSHTLKTRKITSLYLQLMEYKGILKELYQVIDNGFFKTDREVLRELKILFKKYKAFLEEDWEELFSHFVTIHPNFFKYLLLRSSRLTNENLKICAYMKMGVTNKEIAKKMDIKPQSLLQSQSRIKNKLNLEEGVTLRMFINTM